MALYCDLTMAGAILSSDWYRVADLKLRRRSHLQTVRHVYRDDVWYVIQDLQGGKLHRLTLQSFCVFARMNGSRTVQELWEIVCRRFPDNPPSQTEIIQLLSQLHNADLVTGDRRANLTEVDRRAKEEARKTTIGYFKNPLSVRVPLFDPEHFLRRLTPLAHLLFSPLGAVLWTILILAATAIAFLSWDRLEAPRAETILSGSNIFYLASAYIFIKLLHELGHGLAVKRWGGEVREVGVMMLIFFPVPYVDASQSSFFPSKYQRMAVSAAGILVELAIASLALIVWSIAEEGPIATLAYNLFIIGGVSTLIFNGNPLLRFDGYFVFADWIESPNLGHRSNQYFWYVFQKVVLGHKEARLPVVGRREELWLFSYAVAAFVYRMIVMVVISLYVATMLPLLGVLIVLWSLYTTFIVPLSKGIRFMAFDQALEVNRLRSFLRLSVVLLLGFGFFAFVPFSHTTVSDAVLESSPESLIRVQGQGFVSDILVENGDAVKPGDALLRLSEPLLDLELALAEAELENAVLSFNSLPIDDVGARTLWQGQIRFFTTRLDDLRERLDQLIVRSPAQGKVVFLDRRQLSGRLIKQGDVIGSILSNRAPEWRTAVPSDRGEFVDSDTKAISLRPYSNLEKNDIDVRIVFRSPEVTTRLETFGLTNLAGGPIVADPAQEDPTSLTPVVTYLLAPTSVQAQQDIFPVGSRAAVRFTHSPMPLGPRIWRTIQQTFLTYFGS